MDHKDQTFEIEQGLNFNEMNLSEETRRAIEDLGFEEATPIQSQAINLIMAGKDIVGQSQTGTGKTAAFGIPILERIDPDLKKIQAVILCPTRELAIQVSEEFRKLLKYRDNIKVLPVYGGQPIDRQILALKKGVNVIIGTPGRVMDHMDRRTIRMDYVNCVVLDEADEMLDMGFREDIEFILEKTPQERQTIMFSATMPPEILKLTRKYQKDPEFIKVTRREITVPNIEQVYFEVRENTKLEALCRVIDLNNPNLALVFCNTKKKVDELVEQLQGRGYFAEGLHGDMKQAQRDMVMKKFRNKTIDILVATDVAARGIDVEEIDAVFNFDLPQDEEYYVHRIGRTARAGKSGKSFTFVVGKEIYKLRDIMHYTKAKITNSRLPSLADIEEIRVKSFIERLEKTIAEGKLTKYVSITESLIAEDYAIIDVAAALLKMHLHNESGEDIDLDIAPEPRFTDNYGKGKGHDKKDKDQKMATLFLNVGKKHKATVKDIVGAIAGESGVPGRIIGAIELCDEFCFVEVPEDYVKIIVQKVKGKKVKGKKINIEKAKRKQVSKPGK